MADVMFSHQVSLPNMIYDHDCDTQLPNNIFDEEFGPDTKALPASRPTTEPTPMAYMIAKAKLCIELGNILQATSRVGRPVHYEDVLRFDTKLRELHDELPPHLKPIPLDGCHDPAQLIMSRFNIDILYLKIICLLHRKYLGRARQHPRYSYSRKAAIEASLAALGHLKVLHKESQPDGRLRSMGWYVCSIVTKDFILPTMLIVLELHIDSLAKSTGERRDSEGAFLWTPEEQVQMLDTLESTLEIWRGLSDTSIEAFKAYKVLDLMLEKIKQPGNPSELNQASAPQKDMPFASPYDTSEMRPEHSAAMTLGMLSGSMSPDGGSMVNSLPRPNPNDFMGMDLGMGMGGGMTPDFPIDPLSLNNVGSPLSMFSNLGGQDSLSGDFDWVSIFIFLSSYCNKQYCEMLISHTGGL
jgi:hypothetical protein